MRAILRGKIIIAAEVAVIIVLLAIYISGSNHNQISQNIVIDNGLIYKLGSHSPYNGRILDTLDTKIIEYDVVEGLKTGEFCLSSTAGNFMVHGFLKNNMNVGTWHYFYYSGMLESRGSFKDDLPHGKWVWYHENGEVRTVGYYINGKQEGIWETYDDAGVTTVKVFYNSGEIKNEVKAKKFRFI